MGEAYVKIVDFLAKHSLQRYRNVLAAAKKPAMRMYFMNGFFEGLMFFLLYAFLLFGFM